MKREFLEEMGLTPEAVEAVLAEHEKQVRQVSLQGHLQSAVARAGGRNVTAIGALLDLASIGAAEDMGSAMEAAVAALKESDGYLFAAPAPAYAPGAGSHKPDMGKPATLADALRLRSRG